MATIEELESLRWDLRRDCVDIIMAGAGGHIGGDMSVIDALMTLYANHLNIDNDIVTTHSFGSGTGSGFCDERNGCHHHSILAFHGRGVG